MKKRMRWLGLILCAGLLAGCSRYNPPEGGTAQSGIAGEERESGLEANLESGQEEGAEDSPGSSREDGLGSGQKDSLGGGPDGESTGKGQDFSEEDSAPTQRQPVKVKGIYVSAAVAGNEAMMDDIIARVDETELNAVVIDFKTDEGYIAAQVDSPLFQQLDSCRSYIPDLAGLLEKLKAHGIYAIARIVAFQDPYLAEKKQEWSLKKADGSLYRDKRGLAWVNPYRREVWDYLVEAGTQAAAAGFDEVQFDYIRFSTESTMSQVVLSEEEVMGRSRMDVITEFTEYACGKLAPLGVFVSADVFGAVIGSQEDGEAVGQDYVEMAKRLDYICPMIYPSHYGDGNFGLDYPDLYPYETVSGALGKSTEALEALPEEASHAIVRPWLQDFTASYLKHYKKYGDEEVRAQIQAVYDAGYEEWILWNPSNKYHYGGLEHE